ncbi:MAG: hypothetical protein M0R46_02120 [Candidatus Muirbacterium halophilum]|nr:hypothetical protein [Candidatus Muirbacterium halophilum]MCK9474685.1 hypothetical protein [Candidatus Muirbacterium halophilum]
MNLSKKKLKIYNIVSITAFFLLFFSHSVFSANIRVGKVVLSGDILEYKTNEETIFVRGKSHIFYDDMEIFADNIQFDVKNDKVFAVGDVVFWQGNDKTKGDYLEYDNLTGDGYIENAVMIRDSNIMYADVIQLSVRKIEAKNVKWTTCELPHPHYYMEASSIEIFPDIVMYAHNMRYIIHGDTILSQKLYKTDIRPLKENIKYKYGYSKSKGFWGNVDYNFLLTKAASSWLTYNYVTTGSRTLSTRNSFSYGENNSKNIKFNTSNTVSSENTNTSGNYSLYMSTKIPKGNLNFNATFFSREYSNLPENTELNYTIDIRQSLNKNIFNFSDYTLNWKERKDPDGTKYPMDDNIRVLDKIPEIKVNSKNFDIFNKNLKLRYNFLYGKYFEGGTEKLKADKTQYSFNISTKTYEFFGLGKINLNSSSDNSRDSKGNVQHFYNTNLSLNSKIGKEFSITQKWQRSDSFGQTAFSHSNNQTRASYYNTFSYNSKFFRATILSYNYDLLLHSFSGSAYSDIRYKKDKIEFYSKFNININNKELSDFYTSSDFDITSVYNRLSYDFSKESYLRLTVPYDRNLSKYTSMLTELKIPFSDFYIGNNFIESSRVKLNLNWRKDLIKETTTSLNFELKFDLHCWEALIKWDKNTEQGWLEFYIKSFQSKRHRIFYDAELNKIKPIIKKIDTD